MTAILVVDDEPAIVETLAELLAWDGHTVVTATEGAEALGILRSGTRVDVVVIDFMMPVKDGIETIREIRASTELASLKVILTTAVPTAIPKDAPRYDFLLAKPYAFEDLTRALAKLLDGA